jgi:hypothetical protein
MNTNPPKKSRRRTIIKDKTLNTDAAVVPILKPPLTDPLHTVYTKPAGERQVVNVVTILLNEQLGSALERFNACACPLCCGEITRRVLSEMPPAFVQVSTIKHADEVNKKLAEMRPKVISSIAKAVMAGKIKPYHSL